MTIGKWTKKWTVPKSSGDGDWVVGLSDEKVWGCSCPVWKFKKEECHHIKEIKLGNQPEINQSEINKKPEYVLAKVLKPTLKDDRLLVPLVPIGDIKMSVTIAFTMLKYGYSWTEIKKIRRLPDSWTKKAVLNYVEEYGEYTYPENFYD